VLLGWQWWLGSHYSHHQAHKSGLFICQYLVDKKWTTARPQFGMIITSILTHSINEASLDSSQGIRYGVICLIIDGKGYKITLKWNIGTGVHNCGHMC
jgi:hypothetical protein